MYEKYYMGIVEQFIDFPTVTKFWKSVKIRHDIRYHYELTTGPVFETMCEIHD